MKSSRRSILGAGAVASAVVGWSCTAHAAGFANTRIGGEQGTPTSANPTAIYLNPGAMGFTKGSSLALYGSLAVRRATWTRAASDADDAVPPGADGANTGHARLLNVFGGPSLGGMLKLGNLVLGAGFFAPFYGVAKWDKNDSFVNSSKYPLAADGQQRWFSIEGSTSVLYFSAAAAYRLGPLSVGVAANLVNTSVKLSQAKNVGSSGIDDSSTEGRVLLDVDGYNGSFGAGAMLEAVPDQLWIGFSYQAKPQIVGAQALKGTLDTTSPFGNHQFKVGFSQTLPDIYRAGVRFHPKHAPIEFRVFGDWTRWSTMTTQCLAVEGADCVVNADGSNVAGGGVQANVPLHWSDTYGGRLGVSYWVKPEIELLLGGGYETAASPDATLSPTLPDAINVHGTLGARFMLTDSLFLSASYTHIQYLNRDNTGKSTLARGPDGTPVQTPTALPDGGGLYTTWLGIFNGNLEALF